VVAGLRGGSGKSVVAVGLAAALTRRGRRVIPFKKGPDYIDAGWLHLVTGSPCFNLDPYLMSEEVIRHSYITRSAGGDIAVIEGNRGLYDGVNAAGAYSTAELAVLLNLPVLLVVDCTKSTRTVAALVLGCKQLDSRVDIRGVVLNKIGSSRQEKVIREAVREYTGIPVLGALRRMSEDIFRQRHLGVLPFQEHDAPAAIGDRLAALIEESCDLDEIESMARPVAAGPASMDERALDPEEEAIAFGEPVRIGVLRDAAFQFYYPENLEALENEGAELVEINALTATELPELHGLYIGGGFPETSAAQLAANISFLDSLRHAVAEGLPVYAECGGLIYLGESILLDGESHALAGIFPVRFGLEKKPQAHGYTVLRTENVNPYYEQGLEIKGHEFRYSRILDWQGREEDLVFAMQRGVGFMGGRDGLVHNNVLALYTHVHALATPEWAGRLVDRARGYRRRVEESGP